MNLKNSDQLATPKELARTYGAHERPWTVVKQYNRQLELTAANPNLGSTAIAHLVADEFDYQCPRGRVRTWMEGGAPDAVHGIQAADSRGWLSLTSESPIFERGLNNLVAWIFSGGSIAENYTPHFALGRENDTDLLSDFFEAIDLECQIHNRAPVRAVEAVPAEDASILGRVLHTLGAPVGEKAPADLSLPAYLNDAPDSIRKGFAGVYIHNRGTTADSQHGLIIREVRNEQYLDELVDLFRSVTGSTSINRSQNNIYFPKELSQNIESKLPFVDV